MKKLLAILVASCVLVSPVYAAKKPAPKKAAPVVKHHKKVGDDTVVPTKKK